jgi:peroxiredoxin
MVQSLSQQLDLFLSGVLSRTDARTAEALSRLQSEMATSELLEDALKVGSNAPDFTLPSQGGHSVSLSERLSSGAVVLTFFRGGWCPFCTITLRTLQQIARSVERLGASLIAISPQPVDALAALAASQGLTFPLLSDHCNAVARSYGLLWRLDPRSQAIYQRLGHDIPSHNGAPGWELPIPAGYVIAPDRRIVHARVDARVTHRLEPAEVVTLLHELQGERSF